MMILRDFVPCENVPKIECNFGTKEVNFTCKKYNLKLDVSNSLEKLRKNIDLSKFNYEKISDIISASVITNICYKKCDENKFGDVKSIKNKYSHRLAVYLLCNYDLKVAEVVLGFENKGSDNIRMMIANIRKGYVDVGKYKKLVDEIIYKIDKKGRAVIKDIYKHHNIRRKILWNMYFGSEFNKVKTLDNFLEVI